MFDVLLESRARRPRRRVSTMASAVLHGGLIAAAVALANPGTGDAIPRSKTRDPVIYVPVHRATRTERRVDRRSTGSEGQAGQRPVPTPIFDVGRIPPVDLVLAEPPNGDVVAPVYDDGLKTTCIRDCGERPPFGGDVLDARAVDRTPRVIGRAPEPRYPSALRDAGIQGRVVAEFVVDTLGRAELDGLRIDAPQVQLGEAVRAVLPRYRFTPGEAAGRKVRTRVQLPFDFLLNR